MLNFIHINIISLSTDQFPLNNLLRLESHTTFSSPMTTFGAPPTPPEASSASESIKMAALLAFAFPLTHERFD